MPAKKEAPLESGPLFFTRSSWVEQSPPAATLGSGISVLGVNSWLDRLIQAD